MRTATRCRLSRCNLVWVLTSVIGVGGICVWAYLRSFPTAKLIPFAIRVSSKASRTMSDTPATPARPVSLFTIVLLLALFAAFLLVIRYFYHPATTSAFNAPPENLPKDLQWRANPDARRKTLQELHEKEAKQATSYGWVDQERGRGAVADRARDGTDGARSGSKHRRESKSPTHPRRKLIIHLR